MRITFGNIDLHPNVRISPNIVPNSLCALCSWQESETINSLLLHWQVKDTGCGITAQEIPILFTKFTQPQSGSGRKNDGAGLGLAICRRYYFT